MNNIWDVFWMVLNGLWYNIWFYFFGFYTRYVYLNYFSSLGTYCLAILMGFHPLHFDSEREIRPLSLSNLYTLFNTSIINGWQNNIQNNSLIRCVLGNKPWKRCRFNDTEPLVWNVEFANYCKRNVCQNERKVWWLNLDPFVKRRNMKV